MANRSPPTPFIIGATTPMTALAAMADSLRAAGTITPDIRTALERAFKVVRSLPCDVPLGDHPAQYDMTAKHARLASGGPNPFVDRAGCLYEADIQEAMFRALTN